MPLYEPIVPARYTAPLLALVRAEHADLLGEILVAAGVRDADIAAPDAVLSMAQFDRLLRATAACTGRLDLGFEIGRRFTLDMHGALSPALQRCSTVDAVLRLLVRYFHLITPCFRTEYLRHTDHAELIYHPAAYMSADSLREIQELHAVSFHHQLAGVLGARLRGYDIYMSMDPPKHAARYAQLHPARFHFGHLALPQLRIVIGSALLAEPISLPNAARSEPVDLDSAGSAARARRWSDWVILMLREAEGCQPGIDQLAALLNVSPRTLRRQLAREQQIFRELAKRARIERARALLASGEDSISQIAYRLGYNDAANFSHAFRAACGQCPSDFRHAQRAAAPGPEISPS